MPLLATLVACALSSAPIHVTYEDDGTIAVDGERTFVLGVYQTDYRDAPESTLAERLQDLAGAGFSLVHTSPTNLDAVHNAGLHAWVTVGTLDLSDEVASRERLLNTVDRVRDHPAVLFLETEDEPAWTWMKAEPRTPPEPFAKAYPLIKERDPHHLLYMNHGPTNLVTTLQQYNAGTDIVACDIYPINPGGLKHQYALFEDGHQGDLNNLTISQVGEYTDKMRRVAGPNRPVFMVLQAFAWEMLVNESERREEKILYPSQAQSRFMAYSAIIHGANGLLWWGSHYTPQPSQAWNDLTTVTRELAQLKQVLASRTVPLELDIEYHEMGHSVDDGVQWIVKDLDDARYLITGNADRYPCKATIAGLGDWKHCEVVNESREVPIEDGVLTDTWRRFDVHVYRLTR